MTWFFTALAAITGGAQWAFTYERSDLRSDLSAGLTVGAMLVPQAMAYALLAGLPPQVGLFAATVPLIAYAFIGTSRQLAVGPVAIVSLLTASALAPLVEEGSGDYVAAAAMLALLVGAAHLLLGAGRLGFLVNFLSHSVLVGFTAAAALIIGISQAKHILGISIERQEHFYDTVREVAANVSNAHSATIAVSVAAISGLFALKRFIPKAPAALIVVVVSIVATRVLDLESSGVAVVGSIPDALPQLSIPSVDGSLLRSLLGTAMVITLIGFMESTAVAKVYARRNRYEVTANRELVGLGAANIASGLFGGYPVSGGFGRTAVNANAGARTPLASLITAGLVLTTLAFLTPLFSSLPRAVLGAIIVVAIIGLIDVAEIRTIARVKRSDLIGLGIAFFGTLVLGVELGILVAVVASMLVVFARMSMPHSATLGHVAGTTSYRNVERFPEAQTLDGVRIIRIDAALSFVNSLNIKKLILRHAESQPRALIIDASGINDLDATGADMLHELLPDLADRGIDLHLADVKGPVRDVLRNAGIWDSLAVHIHTSTNDAVVAIQNQQRGPADQRRHGIDERCTFHASSELQNPTEPHNSSDPRATTGAKS